MTASGSLGVTFLPVLLAGALVGAAAPPSGRIASPPRLTSIESRVNRHGTSIVIESSEPAGYVATRPEPLTLYVDFRSVGAIGVVNRFKPDARSPIAAIAVESADLQGLPIARVRITLSQAVAHRVRSDRNRIIIEFDKPVADSASATHVLPPESRGRPEATASAASGGVATAAPGAVAGRSSGASTNPPPAAAAALRTAEVRGAADALAPGGQIAAAQAPTSQVAASQGPAPQVPLPQVPSSQIPSSQVPAPILPLPQASPGGPPAAAERRFTGSPVSLDFQGADLRAVLRTFAEVSGLNMVIDPTVQGTVDVALRDVPWDQALDIILRANKLEYVVDGTIVRIAPRDVFTAETRGLEEAAKARAGARAAAALEAEARAAAEQMTTTTRQLSYANGEEIIKLLTDTRVISKYGQAKFDQRTNTVIITDIAGQLPRVQALIDTLDRAQPQVEIEARIVNTNKNYARALGVQWGFSGRVDPTLGNTTNLAFPNSGSLSGQASGPAGSLPAGTAVALPVAGATSAVGLSLGSVNGAFNLDVALSALESSGNARILSTPRVTTQNNIDAEITQGVRIPVQTTANQTTTTAYVDAALSLKVTPQITAAGTVIMKIAVDNGSVGETTPDGKVSINTQRANTTVLVGDGQTTVIGGIFSSTNTTNNDRTPGLGSVPLLKWLFKRDSVSDQNTELLIFITPRIIR